MFAKFFVGFAALILVLALIGWLQAKREKAKNGAASPEEEDILSQKTVDNVHDLNDRFNRARYMDEDGK